MGRRRRASLWGGTGVRIDRGKRLPGYYVRWNEYPNGQRVCRSLNFLTAAAAREWVRQHNARADLRILGCVLPIPMDEAVGEFMEGCASLAANTKTHYRNSLAMWARKLGTGNVCDYDGGHVDTFVARRVAEDEASPATVAKDLRAIGRFFNWAVGRKYSAANPIDAATSLPDGRTSRDRPIVSEAQLGKLISALDTKDRRVAVWLGMTTGLDRGVIEGLSADRIDWDARAIVKIRPKTKRRLAIPIHPQLFTYLQTKAAERLPPLPLLVGLSRQERSEDWWHRATAAAGVPGFLFRDLRAVATARAQRIGGLTLRDAQEMLGHANVQTTANHYHVPDPDVRRRLDQVPLPVAPKRRARKKD